MLLPQSAAFATLKNRLNAVSAIGYLQGPSRAAGSASSSTYNPDRSNRLKTREDSSIRWQDLFEKFRNTQDRARRRGQQPGYASYRPGGSPPQMALDKDEQRRQVAVVGGAGSSGAVTSRPGSGLGHVMVAGSKVPVAAVQAAGTAGSSSSRDRLRTGLGLRFGGGGKKSKK
jgi:vacuole morphology and inheritance protein 14